MQSFQWYSQSVLDWAQNEYVGVNYEGAHLNLLKGSKEVRWDRLNAAVRTGKATLTPAK